MGCNQVTETKNSPITMRKETPCTPEEILRYLNDARMNPKKYAEIVEEECKKFDN